MGLLGDRGRLFLISFTILFVELSSIRWLNASVDVLAYFNNLILISCFGGLGIGCLLAHRRVRLVAGFAPALLLLVVAVGLLHRFGIDVSYTGDHVFAEEAAYYQTGVLTVSLSALAGFLLNVGFFILLGQELGRRLAAVPDPLVAYGWDLFGSLCGVLGYSLLAWLQTPPWVWYGVGSAVLLVFVGPGRARVLGSVALVIVALVLIARTDPDAHWSPYYKVETESYLPGNDDPPGYKILVDNVRIQDALDFNAAHVDSPLLQYWLPLYQLPYHFAAPRRVLILGAGAGNEAVMAHYAEAEVIHAVEIDPIIAGYGTDLHPNRPYTLDGVEVFVDDARSFVASTDETYDLILMSALDSHKQIAGMSNLRLESYTYTVESFRRMKALLAPGGMFCLIVSSYRPWIGDRIYWTLTEAFGTEPVQMVSEGMAGVSVAFIEAPEGALHRSLLVDTVLPRRKPPLPPESRALVATDDWPHLYLENRRPPAFYLVILATMMAISFALVVRAEPSARRPDLHYFFLGAGFMLLQTRSVTQVALLFGSTWLVNAIVFGSILATLLLGNALVMKSLVPRRRVSYVLLVVTLAAGFVFPFDSLLEFGTLARLGATALAVGLPILWAAFIFSTSFKSERPQAVPGAFGSNLLGVVFGGCLEYSSILWGLDALYLVALVLYVASAALAPKRWARSA